MSENIENTQPAETTKENIEVKSPTEALEQKIKDAEQKYLYLYADFENFKKRSVKERQDYFKFAAEPTLTELIPVLDNLERALQFAKPETDPNLMSGLQMVASQFKTTLEKHGVQEIPTMDRPFTPELHESVGEALSDKPKGTIIQEHLKGYTLHGRLLRPSRVMISSGNAGQS